MTTSAIRVIAIATPRVNTGSRYRTTRMAELRIWWREIDRTLLALVLSLMVLGTLAVAAASPASADRLSTDARQLPPLYFYWQHLAWQVIGLAVMFAVSQLSRDNARRLGILIAVGAFLAMVLVPIMGVEINGARRWLKLGMRVQPSEFLKPGFAIMLAWVLTWRLRDPDLPVLRIACVMMASVAFLLVLQPNLGATVLFVGTWFVMMVLSGIPLRLIGWAIGREWRRWRRRIGCMTMPETGSTAFWAAGRLSIRSILPIAP